ncbi:peptidoglycan-binding domain-containing protein [Streptomyces sp. NPDC090442]|uniref:peptidoglycan-binding domain-containing protein n=1 Tax=Streptomyces sp. NPDC090442 TaxID=3365962 RepID=UPI003812BE52
MSLPDAGSAADGLTPAPHSADHTGGQPGKGDQSATREQSPSGASDASGPVRGKSGTPSGSPGSPDAGRPGLTDGPSRGSGSSGTTPTPGSPSVSPAAPPASGPNTGTGGGANGVLRYGDSGAAVSDVQYTLWRLGLYHGCQYGSYDTDTVASVLKFQNWDGVRGDGPGEYGPHTRRALDAWAARL